MAAMTRSERLHLARQATEVRHRGLRDGLAPEAIVEVIRQELPQMFALEALAPGTRLEPHRGLSTARWAL
jgi:hypothetical protein